ncbi:hypothetical protein BD626DRAFT_135537 [Schizophyllum amplum]|uniref:HIT domain-containing protein n=1 Tax=Schizophyllum amplum TaxID=97359 RepID=A0A550C5N4_9AGAR|nr:hypothetical protein BD626DRAFT_135537 [Auriculariopsis ampla]
MAFASRAGCPLCGIVANESGESNNVLWRDDMFTAYRETANPVSSTAHIIIAFNLHVPSIYTLSSSDLPLLVNLRNIATRLLKDLTPNSTPPIRIGFITPPFKDTKIPVTDHLHAHAYVEPADRLGWWRGVAFSAVAWYAIDDLIAEIRESVSNNRVKSGYENRRHAPIDDVPGAGARQGTADGTDTTPPSVAATEADIESGAPSPVIPSSSSPQ